MNVARKQSGGLTTDVIVYLVLLAMAGLQIIVAYGSSAGGEGLAARMLVIAFAQATIAVLFFMHLRWEKRTLVISIAVITLFVLAAMQYGWSDSFRLLNGVPFAHLR